MSERMSAERRAEIARYKQCLKCGSLDVYEELLDELAAVTDECNELRRERDEALQQSINISYDPTLMEERDQARAARDAINREYEDCRQLCLKAEQERDKLREVLERVEAWTRHSPMLPDGGIQQVRAALEGK